MENDISVAMATYNGVKYIEEQLFSIINQTFPPKEIIIVDDCSTDNTVEIVRKIQKNHSSIILYNNEVNLGPINTFKVAIGKCNFNNVALSDQDDIWESNKLEICFQELKKINVKTRPCIVFTDLQMINSNGDLIGSSFWKIQGYNPSKIDLKHILIGNIVTGCTVMMNGCMKNEIAMMPNKVIMHDYWIALIAFGIGNYKAINQTPIRFRVHENNVTEKSKLNIFERIILFVNVFFDSENIYKTENILQAEIFFKYYEKSLNLENYKQLKRFIMLKNKNSLIKKLYVGSVKYL